MISNVVEYNTVTFILNPLRHTTLLEIPSTGSAYDIFFLFFLIKNDNIDSPIFSNFMKNHLLHLMIPRGLIIITKEIFSFSILNPNQFRRGHNSSFWV